MATRKEKRKSKKTTMEIKDKTINDGSNVDNDIACSIVKRNDGAS